MESDTYKAIFPKTRLKTKSAQLLETYQGGKRRATSVEGSITGLGGDIVIFDDPHNTREAESEASRTAVKEYFTGTLSTRVNDDLKRTLIVLHQRVHGEDLSGELLAQGGWAHLKLPATATEDAVYELGGGRRKFVKAGDLLHPARWPQHILDEKQQMMGSTAYSAQFQQEPVPAEGAWFKSGYIHSYTVAPPRETMRITQSWDTATKGTPRSDYSVCTTWGELDGRHYLLDVYRARLDQPELINEGARLYQLHRPDALLIEDHGSGTGMIQLLRRSYGISAKGVRSIGDKPTRFTKVLPMFERRDVLLPKDAPWLADFLSELLSFPHGKHDDQVDSVSQYLNWVNDNWGSGQFDYEFV